MTDLKLKLAGDSNTNGKGEAAEEVVNAGLTDLGRLKSTRARQGTNRLPSRVPIITKPDTAEWVRVRPGDVYKAEVDLLVHKTASNSGDRVGFYIVTDEIADQFSRAIKPCSIRVCINRAKVLQLWVRVITANTWTDSIWTAQKKAETSWIALESDTDRGEYTVHYAEDDLEWGEPVWPASTLQEIVDQAFVGRIITSVDDDVIKALRGKG